MQEPPKYLSSGALTKWLLFFCQ